MDENTVRRLAIEFKRDRHLRTRAPCRICANNNRWSGFNNHHVDGKDFSDDQLRVCVPCHVELHAMLRDFPPIPANIPKSRHKLINRARGRIVINRLLIKQDEEMIEWLINDIDLPPTPDAANENEPPEEDEDEHTPSPKLDELDKAFGDLGDWG